MNRQKPISALRGAAQARGRRRDWLVPASLLLLAAVPAIGGIYRVLHLSLGGEITPANQRFFDGPASILLHGVSCAVFAFTGAFQFTAGGRPRGRLHRARGMLFIPSALIVALTGLWMEATYELPAHDGALLSVFRVVFGAGMIVTTLLGVRSLVRQRFAAHGAWMMRTYAIGMGAGTQVLLLGPWMALAGEPDVWTRGWLMGAGWVINLLFVEWVLRRRARRWAGPAAPSASMDAHPDQELRPS